MAKYSGIISVGAVGGGGHIVGNNSAIPIAVELISFQIGETFFRKIRVCQQFVSQFIHPGDDASIYVYKQMGITNTIATVPGIIGVYVSGLILDATGSWAIVFDVAAAIALFGLVFYLIFASGKRVFD